MINLFRFVLSHPLNKTNRWRAVGRVLAWQFASRLMEGPIAFPFVENSRLFASRGMTGATGNWYCGLHEFEDMSFVLHALREDEHFLDVGANIGSYTVLAAAGPRARVTSVEPIPATFKNLQLNITLNALSDIVHACQLGVSNEFATLRFSAGLDTVNHVLAPGEGLDFVEVPVTTIDDLIGDDCPTVMKIDVEGHEVPALRGARRMLSNPALLAIVMETNGSGERYGWSDSEMVDLVRKSGFESYSYDPINRELLKAKTGTGNTIFIRDIDEVARRLRSAPKYKVGSALV